MAEAPEPTEQSGQQQQAPQPQRAQPQPQQGPPQRPSEEAPSAEEPRIPDVPVSQLIDDASSLLGVSAWVARGALREHDSEELMSIDAAKGEVEDWLQQPVKTPAQEEEE